MHFEFYRQFLNCDIVYKQSASVRIQEKIIIDEGSYIKYGKLWTKLQYQNVNSKTFSYL